MCLKTMKTVGRVLTCALALSVTTPSFADNFIPYGTPNIDGKMDTNEWQALGHTRMARFYGNDQYSDLWMMWDNDNLYIAGKLQDTSIQEDGNGSNEPSQTWDDDSLEIYLHPTFPLPNKLSENSRVFAFTPTGKYRRLDRGCWGAEPGCNMTTGLEKPGNAINKINDPGNFFDTDLWMWQSACKAKQPEPAQPQHATIRFKHAQDNKEWRFEAALPWQLVGTRIGQKIVEGQDCPIGDGVIPDRFPVKDGTPLWMNFYQVHADDSGKVSPRFDGANGGMMKNAIGTQSPNGIMKNEWTVYQGDRYHPNEWQAFILVNPSEYALPKFDSKEINSWSVSAVDGRRVRLQLKAPHRGNGGSAYRYAVRYQEGSVAVDKDAWKSMTEFEQAYLPVSPGQWQEFDVIGLTPGKNYTFAVRAVDEQGRMSDDILVTKNGTQNDPKTFVTVSPTGRSLMLSDGTPFVLVGETGLMPWLPLRGLYPGELCDEKPSDFFINPPANSTWPRARSCSSTDGTNKKGEKIVGVWRNYSTEKIFYYCHFSNGEIGTVALLEPSDTDPTDNCEYQESRKLATTNPTEPVEGAGVAERYFQKLKANGVNVITVFVESLDLDASPILLDAKQNEIIGFLDNVLNLARQNNIYVLFRLYDTFYYKDDNFKTVGRKWSDTSWAKGYGATQPNDFFEKNLYDSHKERMKPLLHRYRDDPNVFGWDIVNEIDNKERFNTASYEKRKNWLTEIAHFVQQEDSNHLVFYSFLTWDPKDDTFYRASVGATSNEISGDKMTESGYLGMDAALAYRLPNIDLAMTHAYYAHVANPWEPAPADYLPPLEIARGISYGFYQIRDGRPMQDGESSPNSHLYRKGYGDDGFDETKDNQTFRDSAWLHFVSGGVGANLEWPADLRKDTTRDTVNQLSDKKRSYLGIFKKAVDGIKWRGDQLTVDHYQLPNGLLAFVRQDMTNAIIYVYNPNRNPLHEIVFPELPEGEAGVKVINTENGTTLFEDKYLIKTGNSLNIQATSDSFAVIIKGMSGKSPSGLTTPIVPVTVEPTKEGYLLTSELWTKAVIHTDDGKTLNAVWKLGGDETTQRGDRVIWGYFYANPKDVTWGDENNPDIFVKVWFDSSGRVDVNFFHVSVPNIEVFSCMTNVENCNPATHTTTPEKRYARHSYQPKAGTRIAAELLDTTVLEASNKVVENPKHYALPFQHIELGSIFQLDGGKNIAAAWHNGGSNTTASGDQVAWGYFYANPNDVDWGSEQNPEVYVKFWYDKVANRIDVNFFHVSAPSIEVYSGHSNNYSGVSQITEKQRYARHQYTP